MSDDGKPNSKPPDGKPPDGAVRDEADEARGSGKGPSQQQPQQSSQQQQQSSRVSRFRENSAELARMTGGAEGAPGVDGAPPESEVPQPTAREVAAMEDLAQRAISAFARPDVADELEPLFDRRPPLRSAEPRAPELLEPAAPEKRALYDDAVAQAISDLSADAARYLQLKSALDEADGAQTIDEMDAFDQWCRTNLDGGRASRRLAT